MTIAHPVAYQSSFESNPYGDSSRMSPRLLRDFADLHHLDIRAYSSGTEVTPGIETTPIPRTESTERLGGCADAQDSVKLCLEPTVHRQEQFVSLQKWQGEVLEEREDIFVARLYDLTASGPEEEVEFFAADVPVEDRDLLKPGAVFYWNIGYLDKCDGQRFRVSSLRFRRLPAWTSQEIEAAKKEALKVAEKIGWK